MARKRKRPSPDGTAEPIPYKRLKSGDDESYRTKQPLLNHPVLSRYYPHVSSLREYLLSQLPQSSRSRRREIESLTVKGPILQEDLPLVALLESVVVGYFPTDPSVDEARGEDFAVYCQSQLGSTAGSSLACATSMQEMVLFSVWWLFNRDNLSCPHLLCQGFRKVHINGKNEVRLHTANRNVTILSRSPWTKVITLLGFNGDGIIRKLLLDCGVFVRVQTGSKNLRQLSGRLLSELPLLRDAGESEETSKSTTTAIKPKKGKDRTILCSLGDIILPRSRMLYAHSLLTGKGQFRYGFRRSHPLNQYADPQDPENTVQILRSMFPRQFGLDNVFASADRKRTAYRVKGYTQSNAGRTPEDKVQKISAGIPRLAVPKRLRVRAFSLVKHLQERHGRCRYTELLQHYCPKYDMERGITGPQVTKTRSSGSSKSQLVTHTLKDLGAAEEIETSLDARQSAKSPSMIDFASPTASVSAFCRAVLYNLIPTAFWGVGDAGIGNRDRLMISVDQLIKLRRRENLSLHDVCQGLKISCMDWLSSIKTDPSHKLSRSDTDKRIQLLSDFVFFVFDSLVIPLVRSNFYVTESQTHGNRLFFFRHDIWQSLTAPSLNSLRCSLFEEMNPSQVQSMLKSRDTGFSQLRLVPKADGVRPIVNLTRKQQQTANGQTVVGRSINDIMKPVFNVLSYEKTRQQKSLGSSMFSVGDLYPRLKDYQIRRSINNRRLPQFYFAKVDVKNCYDTIPQHRLLGFIERLMSEAEYRSSKHVVLKNPDTRFEIQTSTSTRPIRRFKWIAQPADNCLAFPELVNGRLAKGRHGLVFAECEDQRIDEADKLIRLLTLHVKKNTVRVGKQFFRQKEGIPQGSIVSSLLCNLFYADMEREHLHFLDGESLLLRVTDDFLLITTNRQHARRFLKVMHIGVPAYGMSVNSAKTLANFEVTIRGVKIARIGGSPDFPYCGNSINTRTLEIAMDREKKLRSGFSNTLTIDTSRRAGKNFYQKALRSFTIQCHARFLDSSLNSMPVVLSNLYQKFLETAMKFYRYFKCLTKQLHAQILIRTIKDLVALACNLIRSKKQHLASEEFECAVTDSQIRWLAAKAFSSVLSRKQSNFRVVLPWLDRLAKDSELRRRDAASLEEAVRRGEKTFEGTKY